MQLTGYSLFIRIGLLVFPGVCLLWYFRSHISSIPARLLTNDCAKSLRESDQFICEPDQLWEERKHLYRQQDKENMVKRADRIFFLSNWEPNFHCSHAARVGRMGDGGKWVCDLFRLGSRPKCLVYSAGSNGDFSFETAMKKAVPNCEIHTFDTNLFKCPANVCIFHQMRLGDGKTPPSSKSWSKIIEELGHRNRTVDVFKIDVEGGEFDLFPALFTAEASSLPQQVLVEIHPAEPARLHSFFELFRANQYVIFNKEPNLIAGPRFMEYTFLRLNAKFFE